jgi:hypothetical protein
MPRVACDIVDNTTRILRSAVVVDFWAKAHDLGLAMLAQ